MVLRRTAIILFWAALLWLSLYFFFNNVISYLYGYRSRLFGDSFFSNRVWVLMHLFGGTLALLLGPVQFWPAVRNRFRWVHRWAGFIYLFGILLIGVSASRLSLISSCVPCRISLFLLTIFAVFFSWAAWRGIRLRNIKLHRQMMVRSYVCVLAFVAVRVEELMPLNFLFGTTEDPLFRRVMNEYFFSFVPLLITELLMVWIPAATLKMKPTKK